MDLQFYPTPRRLAQKAWDKFKDKDIIRLLEPSAGEGDLLEPMLEKRRYQGWRSSLPVDCFEFDISRHAILREKGVNVIGHDFLDFRGAALYSHCLMNPPFQDGCKHLLKAWEIMFDGEIVAIINAETIRNPHTAERKMLVNLIDNYGSVEFLQEEFLTSETERKTAVEIALVHLEKDSRFEVNFLAGLEVDSMTSSGLASGYQEFNEIAMHQGMIENSVTAFNAAVKASREQVFAAARARYYATLLGSTMETLQTRSSNQSEKPQRTNLDTVRKEMQEAYDDLKNRAWTQVLRSTQFTSKLSSKAAKKLEAQFETIKQLEFTVSNVYSFLIGLINKADEINVEMMLDVFDSISRYHHGNRVYFKGWHSNSKHRTAAFKIKTTRFIIPGHGHESWRSSPDYETLRFLGDIDKVCAMLTGVKEVENSLEDIFKSRFDDLKAGIRVSSKHFDCRLYPAAGTIHFFPTDRKLIDRFNRLVGRHRQWLPEENESASAAFFDQYENAEKYSAEIDAELAKRNKSRSWWNGIERDITSNEVDVRERATAEFDDAINTVLRKHGVNPESLLEPTHVPDQLLLLSA